MSEIVSLSWVHYFHTHAFRSDMVQQQPDEAERMLDTFASVGATHFDLTYTNIDSENRGFRPEQSLVPGEELNAKAVFRAQQGGKTTSLSGL